MHLKRNLSTCFTCRNNLNLQLILLNRTHTQMCGLRSEKLATNPKTPFFVYLLVRQLCCSDFPIFAENFKFNFDEWKGNSFSRLYSPHIHPWESHKIIKNKLYDEIKCKEWKQFYKPSIEKLSNVLPFLMSTDDRKSLVRSYTCKSSSFTWRLNLFTCRIFWKKLHTSFLVFSDLTFFQLMFLFPEQVNVWCGAHSIEFACGYITQIGLRTFLCSHNKPKIIFPFFTVNQTFF